MFDKETVLILGAGASCHYGYPTGEELVERIIEKTKELKENINERLQRHGHSRDVASRSQFNWEYAFPQSKEERIRAILQKHPNESTNPVYSANPTPLQHKTSCDLLLYAKYVNLEEDLFHQLHELLKSLHPLNIDSFLRYNPRYAPLAKTLIADILLECDGKLPPKPEKYNGDAAKWKKDNDWYRYLFHALTYGCKVDAKDTSGKADIAVSIANLTIITFNYDTSLERYLRKAFQRVEAFQNRTDELMDLIKKNIYHVYGKLADEDFYDLPPEQRKAKRSDIVRASADIEVVDIDKQEKRKNNLKKATGDALKKAQRVVILGYGFDGENNKLLDIFNVDGIKPHNKHVAYTNYGNSQRIERKFIELKKGEPRRFDTSTRTVAEALQFDFDLTW
jgi:hypothetical protein